MPNPNGICDVENELVFPFIFGDPAIPFGDLEEFAHDVYEPSVLLPLLALDVLLRLLATNKLDAELADMAALVLCMMRRPLAAELTDNNASESATLRLLAADVCRCCGGLRHSRGSYR